jgi:ElaB/YqjD/DUF883 family membrane-anchored ribosome-binding protein
MTSTSTEQRIAELEERERQLGYEQTRLWKEIEEAKAQLIKERVEVLGETAEDYAKKLKRIKAFTDAFVEETAWTLMEGQTVYPRKRHLSYGFRKIPEVYTTDDHEPTEDPLDYQIAEFDMLGMQEELQVRFDYYSEATKDFVMKWMKENMPDMIYEDDLFGFRKNES